MSASTPKSHAHLAPPLAFDLGDTLMVSSMRLVLAICVLLTVFIDTSPSTRVDGLGWTIFGGYVVYGLILCICSALKSPSAESKLVHWVDVSWYGMIVLLTGGADSVFFALFFFAIFSASFRWGFEEGARITIASVLVFAACAALFQAERDLPSTLLRSAFMLAFGYMSARWGESKLRSKRRLILLHEVTRLSNPRFGISQTIASLMEKSRSFFGGSGCLLVMKDKDAETYSLRMTNESNTQQATNLERIGSEAASPFMAFSPQHVVVYSRSLVPAWPTASHGEKALIFDQDTERWSKCGAQLCQPLAELLEAESFITAPLLLRNGTGRIYVISKIHRFNKADALFLSQITAQAFPVIENVALLDSMASHAALQERKKIAWDLHDTAIQPYVGLSMGLSAMRLKAAPDNPLAEDLDKLMAMTVQVIGNLRRFAGSIKDDTKEEETAFVLALRKKAEHVKEFHGIDITVVVDGDMAVGDRLGAEVLQLVSEGLSNICRHTVSQRGLVKVRCTDGRLKIQIGNECTGTAPVPFVPHSITERVAALGGTTQVMQDPGCGTIVHVEIPI